MYIIIRMGMYYVQWEMEHVELHVIHQHNINVLMAILSLWWIISINYNIKKIIELEERKNKKKWNNQAWCFSIFVYHFFF